MAEITVMGAGGEYMESVVIVNWHKKLGDFIREGDLLVTVETAKAATEIEATTAGILTEIRAQIGEEVPLGAILGIIGDDLSQDKSQFKQEAVSVEDTNRDRQEAKAKSDKAKPEAETEANPDKG